MYHVNAEFVACLLTLNGELEDIIEWGLTLESMETIEGIHNRLNALIQQLGEEGAA